MSDHSPHAKEVCVKPCGRCLTDDQCRHRRRDWSNLDRALPPGQLVAERAPPDQQQREEAIRQLLGFLLPQSEFNPDGSLRAGLAETPARVAKAWAFWTQGYHQDPAALLKTFDDGAEGVDEMVTVRDIEIYSHCEHHMAPFFGVAHIAYIPQGKIVGLSKLARVADAFARRLQVQERLTNQIADCINEALEPLGVGVVIEAKHMCMCSRGVGKQGSTTITSALRGAMRHSSEARAEFLAFARSR